MDVIVTVIAVTVSWEYRDVEIHQIAYLDTCCLLYVRCTSVKLRSSLNIYVRAVGRTTY